MTEETHVCANCNKGEGRTGKDCPTRSGCFTPNYKNWDPISDQPDYASDYKIESFTFANGEFVVTVENVLSGRSELVEVTASDIIGLLKK